MAAISPPAVQPRLAETPAHERYEYIDAAQIPGGGALHLIRQGDFFSIQFDDDELMGSHVRHSEQALATLACAHLGRTDGRVLIGGLGMGFTLGATLAAWGPDARVVVVELVPEVVTWARGPLAHIIGGSLSDPRVTLEVGDVHDAIVREPSGFDAILLDVDNGPDGLVQLANERLYCDWGLRATYAALRPSGVLAIWSAYADADFVARLERAGFSVEEFTIPAEEYNDNVQHTVWLAAKPGHA
ncbi:spermidine synthase [Novosphingobium sp.]|uniref:spermidine synthase n=1 Tax=Novosphingobium sp. TaxID=1874826 RepID=UPI003D0DE7A1